MISRPARSSVACLALLAATVCGGVAAAQVPTVSCGAPLTESAGICTGTVARSDSVQQFNVELRLSGGVISGIPIVFRADSGTLVRDSVVTDANGIAQTIWYRPRGTGPVGIAADVRTASGSILKYVQLRPRETQLHLRTAQDARFSDFPGGTGRRLVVEILQLNGGNPVAITDTTLCARQRVAFYAEGTGARVTPDTAGGAVYAAKEKGDTADFKPGCFAAARLALGSDVGRHEIRTLGLPSTGYRVTENARLRPVNVRHMPQIILAAVVSRHRSFNRVEKETVRTYRVQRILPSGETATFDSAVVSLSADDGGGWSTTAMAGFSTPILSSERFAPLADRLSLTLGIDADAPRQGQFLGVSILRSTGLVPYNFPVDLHLLAHRRKFEVLEDAGACAVALTEVACGTRSRAYWGPSLAVSFDASAVVSEAIKKLGG